MTSGNPMVPGTLGPRTLRLVYGTPDPEEIAAELRLATEIDLAHVVMLAEQGLLEPRAAQSLISYIAQLRRNRFTEVVDLPMPRGLYLAYEGHLSDVLGADVGGRLHTGRSRNDLKATVTALRLRDVVLDLVSELQRLRAVLLSRASAHRDVIMPVYTHFQAAMPVTYGYHLLGVALALARDERAVRDAAADLRRSPLGAGAVAGTDLPIAPARTAELLGFDAPPLHAIDAVACRDAALRVLGAAAGAGITVSRLAADLQLWSTAEFGLVRFPDRLIGGSSAMPQKRNAFLLEHLKAKPAIAVGAWASAASATKAAPFTNTIEVGTEAVAAVWPGLAAVADTVALAQTVVSGARPCPERMEQRARQGFVTATALANTLVRAGVPFRTAHSIVAGAVREAIGSGGGEPVLPDDPETAGVRAPGLAEAVAQCRYGGGPGDFDAAFTAARAQLVADAAWSARARARRESARARLALAAEEIAAGEIAAGRREVVARHG